MARPAHAPARADRPRTPSPPTRPGLRNLLRSPPEDPRSYPAPPRDHDAPPPRDGRAPTPRPVRLPTHVPHDDRHRTPLPPRRPHHQNPPPKTPHARPAPPKSPDAPPPRDGRASAARLARFPGDGARREALCSPKETSFPGCQGFLPEEPGSHRVLPGSRGDLLERYADARASMPRLVRLPARGGLRGTRVSSGRSSLSGRSRRNARVEGSGGRTGARRGCRAGRGAVLRAALRGRAPCPLLGGVACRIWRQAVGLLVKTRRAGRPTAGRTGAGTGGLGRWSDCSWP